MNAAAASRALAWSVLVAASAPGADPELDRLEREYLTQRDAITRPLLTSFAEKLRVMHASLTQRSDPHAAAAKAELDQTLARLSLPAGAEPRAPTAPRPPGGTPATNRPAGSSVELRGPKAALTGGAIFDEKIVSAVQFRGKGATAVWNLPALKAGRYRVRLECGCPAGFGALASVAFGDQPPGTFTVLPTSESGQAVSFNFGEVEIPSGTTTLKIAMTDAPARTKGDGGFNLHLVAIAPVEGTLAD